VKGFLSLFVVIGWMAVCIDSLYMMVNCRHMDDEVLRVRRLIASILVLIMVPIQVFVLGVNSRGLEIFFYIVWALHLISGVGNGIGVLMRHGVISTDKEEESEPKPKSEDERILDNIMGETP
jgi:hypothetical protein